MKEYKRFSFPSDKTTDPVFHINHIPIHGDAILAPMDGVSDWPFRSLCRFLGSAMSYTEFVKAEDLLAKRPYTTQKLYFETTERPVAVQIYGDNPKILLEAALRVQELQPDVIDINMGCPAKTVANRGAGVGLMRTPLTVARIFKTLSAALEVPVTGKMRLGWDDYISYKLIARIVEENGGALIALHGRTKNQGYGGQANWDAIAEICNTVKIPVIGNGDVKTVADIARMKAYTGCQAVMIGRAALANPWLFAGLDREEVLPDRVGEMVQAHLMRNIQFYGEEHGQRLFRKYATQYLALRTLARDERKKILEQYSLTGFLTLAGSAGLH